MFNIFSAATGIAGLGLSLYGGIEASKAAKQEADIEKQMAGVEIQQDAVRRSGMELSASRQQIEQVRREQSARALSLSTAAAQGSQFNSGVQGAAGDVSGQTDFNRIGISQNLAFGEKMFDLNGMLDQLKMQKADVQSSMATDQGIMSFGSALTGAAKIFG